MEMEPFGSLVCEKQIGILSALLSGVQDGVCVEFGTGTVFAALCLFAAGVAVMQWVARRLLASVRNDGSNRAADGPIRSTRLPGQTGGPVDSR